MKNFFDIKWLVLLLGLIGFAFIFIAQEGNIVTIFFGAFVLFISLTYFATFEKDFITKVLPSPRYKPIKTFISSIRIDVTYSDTDKEISEEKKRFSEFDTKFPMINKIPVVRTLVRAMYKEGWKYSVGFLAIMLLSGVLLSYNLGTRDFRGDEFQVISAASGYLNTGDFYRWDWVKEQPVCAEKKDECIYDRAYPHTWLIAQSYKIFGISEWSSRIVSVLFALLTVLLSYFFTKFFTGNKTIALFASLTLALYPTYINIGQYTRMYSLLIPLFLILSYLFYKGIVGTTRLKKGSKKVRRFIEENFNFNYTYLIAALLLLYITYLIHVNVLIIVPSVLLFIVYMAITKREKKYITTSLLGLLGIIATVNVYIFTDWLHKISGFLSFFGRSNVIYLEYLTRFPLPGKAGIVLLIFGAISLVFIKRGKIRDRLMYLYIIVLFSLFFFTYMADRYASFVYISHVTPIAIALVVSFYFLIVGSIRVRIVKLILILFLVGNMGYAFITEFPSLYGYVNKRGNFSVAYQTIVENYDPEREVIFGQFLRRYYLQDIDGGIESISMLKNHRYTYEQFLVDLERYDAGWVTWEKKKSYHLQKEIRNHVTENFQKVHGEGIDDTRVEMYYFDRTDTLNEELP